MREQARTAHEMTIAIDSLSKEAGRITNANRNHLDAAERVRGAVSELRRITNRNADGVRATLSSTTGLVQRARALGDIMDSMAAGNSTANGNETGKAKVARSTSNRRSKKHSAPIDSENNS